jgi:hypothetical protein
MAQDHKTKMAAVCVLLAAGSSFAVESQLYDALAFIESRLAVQQWEKERFEHHRWKPGKMIFRPGEWQWDESKEEWSPGFRKVVLESYKVDPRELATPVRAGSRSITFECRVSKCIKVTGASATSINDGAPKQEAIDAAKSKNTWFFASAAEAKRVAHAMNTALKELGAKPRAF